MIFGKSADVNWKVTKMICSNLTHFRIQRENAGRGFVRTIIEKPRSERFWTDQKYFRVFSKNIFIHLRQIWTVPYILPKERSNYRKQGSEEIKILTTISRLSPSSIVSWTLCTKQNRSKWWRKRVLINWHKKMFPVL